jgi:hypothetical protein
MVPREYSEEGSVSSGTLPVLVVAAEEVAGDGTRAVAQEIRRGAGDTRTAVHVVCPILVSSGLKQTLGDVDDAIPPAEERLEKTLRALREAGLEASGEVGDSDPIIAIQDALQKHGAQRILVVGHAEEDERAHSEKELLERINREFEQPATELYVTRQGDEQQVEGKETVSAGADRSEEGHRLSRNLPPLRLQDGLGIAVGLVGTIILIILAANCPDKHEEQGGELVTFAGGCALRYLIAGGFFLINLGHVGALLLMESVGYRGPFERFFARLSLIGTPLAILVSAFVV